MIFEGYLSSTSVWQLALAVPGFFFTLFWMAVVKGFLCQDMQGGVFKKRSLFMRPGFRYVFRLHRFKLIAALCLALGLWPVIIAYKITVSVVSFGHIPYAITDWSTFFVTMGLAFVGFAAMRGQGLALKLDEYLTMSWEAGDQASLHLRKEKVEHLSYEVITHLIIGAQQFRSELKKLDLNADLKVESWLLAPRTHRHDSDVKKLHALLKVPFRKALSSRRILIIPMYLVAAVCLLFRSPKIMYQLRKMPMPKGEVLNGLYVNKYTDNIQKALADIKPDWKMTPIYLKRMSTISVIEIVIVNPRAYIEIGGWAAGVTLSDQAAACGEILSAEVKAV
ncbi:hypothetical protein CWR53_21915 [Pseudomonas sp. SGAir0191]|uniref:hypothetical protein n=1 Tax=Pseudomonas sp. SGAir0191 TaxID=2217867 RepID=UPI0010FC5E63|nr:hypothetical protein [Pseudomonas sp. SGAir0191]AUA35056.2 hypothetical protein CWR53_21915 [Pseudomonas sp. SGAir0191]